MDLQLTLVVSFIISLEYGVDKETELINYDEVRKLAPEHKPKLIRRVPLLILELLILKSSKKLQMK